MKHLTDMNQEELEAVSDDVVQCLLANLPRDTVWVLLLGDQNKYRAALSNKQPDDVVEILDFVGKILTQQIIEHNQ